nr:hypothetical protein Iba_chr06bCG16160 [Ipomoea batatas]
MANDYVINDNYIDELLVIDSGSCEVQDQENLGKMNVEGDAWAEQSDEGFSWEMVESVGNSRQSPRLGCVEKLDLLGKTIVEVIELASKPPASIRDNEVIKLMHSATQKLLEGGRVTVDSSIQKDVEASCN